MKGTAINPKVSVVIPAYNCGRFIGNCLESLSAQMHRDWEAIVVDDGSRDDTRAIAEEWASKDPRIKVLSQPNSGKASIPRNVGTRHAGGEFICFLDADDLLHPGKLSAQLAVMARHPGVACLYHNVRYIDVAGNILPETYYDPGKYLALARHLIEEQDGDVYMFSRGFYGHISMTTTGIHTSSVMIRRSAVEAEDLLFASELAMGEDDDLWFRIAKKYRIALLNRELSFYRQNENGISHDYERALVGSIATHSRNMNRAPPDLTAEQITCYRKRIARRQRHLGYFYFRENRVKDAREQYMRSLKMAGSLLTLLDLCKTYIPPGIVDAFRRRG